VLDRHFVRTEPAARHCATFPARDFDRQLGNAGLGSEGEMAAAPAEALRLVRRRLRGPAPAKPSSSSLLRDHGLEVLSMTRAEISRCRRHRLCVVKRWSTSRNCRDRRNVAGCSRSRGSAPERGKTRLWPLVHCGTRRRDIQSSDRARISRARKYPDDAHVLTSLPFKARGDVAIGVGVFLEVRGTQISGNPADGALPDHCRRRRGSGRSRAHARPSRGVLL